MNSDDSGTLNALNGLWQIPDDMKQAAYGDKTLNTTQLGSKIPPVGTGAVPGSFECRKRCGIEHGK